MAGHSINIKFAYKLSPYFTQTHIPHHIHRQTTTVYSNKSDTLTRLINQHPHSPDATQSWPAQSPSAIPHALQEHRWTWRSPLPADQVGNIRKISGRKREAIVKMKSDLRPRCVWEWGGKGEQNIQLGWFPFGLSRSEGRGLHRGLGRAVLRR